MKISIDIDCTPEEARQFLGLPDMGPLQDEMKKRMESGMSDWMNFQKAFWGKLMAGKDES
jgi:hypothetical protein